MTRKSRSKYGDRRIGRAVSALAMSMTAAADSCYYILHLGGALDPIAVGKHRETLRRLGLNLDQHDREYDRQQAAASNREGGNRE